MKIKQFLTYFAVLGIFAVSPLLTACGGGSLSLNINSPNVINPITLPITVLSAEEIAALKFMREEEKLAHDIYVELYSIWGANVFYQISLSETTHTEAILSLLNKYGIDDPAAGKAPGVFESPVLNALYGALVTMGKVNLIEALKVGALIEETDIRDINEKKTITDEDDIVTVYNSLLCGSRNHLRSFNSNLLSQGVTYIPQVIIQAEWDAIANSPKETCGGNGII